jgi:hypothetical protein
MSRGTDAKTTGKFDLADHPIGGPTAYRRQQAACPAAFGHRTGDVEGAAADATEAWKGGTRRPFLVSLFQSRTAACHRLRWAARLLLGTLFRKQARRIRLKTVKDSLPGPNQKL